MKKKITITSLARTRKDAPWRVGVMKDGQYTYFTTGENGDVAMSPRFDSFVKAIEEKVRRYPVDVSFHSIVGDRIIEVNVMNERFLYVDCGVHTRRLVDKASFYYESEVRGRPLEISTNRPPKRKEEAAGTFQAMAEENESGSGGGTKPGEAIVYSNEKFVKMGYVTKIIDGDTMDVSIINPLAGAPEFEGTVRLNGIDCAEKKDEEQNSYKDNKNSTFAKMYGVETEDMYNIADEATEHIKKLLDVSSNREPLVIIHFDRTSDGDGYLKDHYDRYVADVYATSEMDPEILKGKIDSGKNFIHLAKSLLMKNSKIPGLTHVPLAYFNLAYANSGTVLNPYAWISELGLSTIPTDVPSFIDPEESNPDRWASIAGGALYEETVNTDTIEFATNTEPKDNRLDFFEPYDDRLIEFAKEIKEVPDLKKHPKIRIGDVILTVPPLAIETNRISNITKVKTMRTKSSMMVNKGKSLNTITMDLYFHDLESINGKKRKWKEDSEEEERFFYVDGLRPLLAQFAKAPFVPIFNYHINEILGVHDVALLDIQVSSVPNFPESISARVTLVEFNSEAYTMGVGPLEGAINFPLLRWYYNQSLEDRGSKYRYFKPLDGPISSDIKFSIAMEEYLEQRKEAIMYIKNADSPEKKRVELKQENNVYSSKKSDEAKILNILSQYNRYKTIPKTEGMMIDQMPSPIIQVDGVALEIIDFLMEKYGIGREKAENLVTEAMENFSYVYDGIDTAQEVANGEIFLPYQSTYYNSIRFGVDEHTNHTSVQLDMKSFYEEGKPLEGKENYGVFIIRNDFASADNKKIMMREFERYLVNDRFVIPADALTVNTLKRITKKADEMEAEIDKYEDEFNRMVNVIEASENGVPMVDYEIPGGMVPISLNVHFENQFSMAHVQSSEAVSLQYMGAGDASVDMVLEVTQEGAKAINELVSKSDYYSKLYNQGITNGFIGIENDLAALFGLKTIMIETLNISTVQGYPDRLQVIIKAVNFDKTQRQREELVAIPGNAEHIDLEQLVSNRNAYASDRMIEARLKFLEVYPDLELPTYEKLNAELPYFDTGGIKEYKNNSGATYVDPDFYFSTKDTFRQIIENAYAENHDMHMYDTSGVSVYTNNNMIDKLFDASQSSWDKMKEIQDTDGVEPLNWVYSWGDSDSDKSEDESSADYTGVPISEEGEDLSFGNSDIQAFFEEEKDGKPAFKNFPSKAEWETMFGTSYNYEKFSKNPEGDEAEIYKRLSELVDKHFASHYSYPDFVKDCRGDMKKADENQKYVSYERPEVIYKDSAKTKYYDIGNAQRKKIKDYLKDNDRETPNTKFTISIIPGGEVSRTEFIKTDKKITKERFMVLLKSFLDKSSRWKHFKEDAPVVSKGRVGLAQYDITDKEMSLEEAKKLLYNWDYNLTKAVEKLSELYKSAAKLKEDVSNWETYCRPWDTMFALYYDPEGEYNFIEDLAGNELASSIDTRFSFYATKPFNTGSGYNKEVYKYIVELTKEDMLVIGEGKEAEYVDALLDLDYYTMPVLESNNLTVDSERKIIKDAMRKHLEGLTIEQLRTTYTEHIQNLYNLGKEGLGMEIVVFVSIPKKDDNGYKYSWDILRKAIDLNQSVESYEKAATDSLGSGDTRLYNDVDPRIIYKEMFHDLRHNDHRGRLLRAFPGFQMFIVHEGDYFGKYKFWDNLYGFNAIESIDVHKSRKIAADTAVISMTNIYSNLTTRRTDVDYIDRQFKFWDNYIFNKIPDDLVEKKAHELHKNILLQTGARIHLRMGYGSAAQDLPVVFNGTITEMEIGDYVQVVAQGDGVELGNAISGDPDDVNKNMFKIEEPRDLLCSLMSSKGSWIKDYLNGVSDGLLAKNNPLGIQHFGLPFDTSDSTAARPLGNILWWNDEYGEVAQNIYSSNGTPTFSQWMHPNGKRNDIFTDFEWKNIWENKHKMFNPGDEDNVKVKLYNSTVWDIAQTVAYSSPDYIAAVMPFEQRSTLFFGKPYWRAAYQYDSRYEFDAEAKTWARHLVSEARRPYMQTKIYTSAFDIIENNIQASEEKVFTNVVVNYGKHQTPVIYADVDIRYDKHKTRVVDANIVGTFNDYYTSEVIATYYGASELRDSMKDMYQGNLLVLGDPSVKPHDMMGIMDEINDMTGSCLVKSVTHHFSQETGFVTSIEPDLYVVNDDMVMMQLNSWFNAMVASIAPAFLTVYMGGKLNNKLLTWAMKDEIMPKKIAKWIATKGLRNTLGTMKGIPDVDKILGTLDEIIAKEGNAPDDLHKRLTDELNDAVKNMDKMEKDGKPLNLKRKAALLSGLNSARLIQKASTVTDFGKKVVSLSKKYLTFNIFYFVAEIGFWVAIGSLFEKYNRYIENMQAVVAFPLTYRGKELTAGINGHGGMVYGDAPGRIKKMMDSQFFDGDDEDEHFGEFMIQAMNLITGNGGKYSKGNGLDLEAEED